MNIEVYTDGSATIATKPGGYGWVMVVNGIKHSEGNGHMPQATNNDAEMMAAIAGLAAALKYVYPIQTQAIAEGRDLTIEVTLCSDSQITLGWANGTYRFKQEKKAEKFLQLRQLMQRLKAKTRWVRGHSGHEHNERCDELANLGRNKLTPNDTIPGKPKKKAEKITVSFKEDVQIEMIVNGETSVVSIPAGSKIVLPGSAKVVKS